MATTETLDFNHFEIPLSPTKPLTVEQQVEALEQEVGELRERVAALTARVAKLEIAGSGRNDEVRASGQVE